ncbi:hypothetical protein EB58_01488 [Enterococcus faecalis]|nr:hypothetical protein EB58_01488 [Enterococcus faecalis]
MIQSTLSMSHQEWLEDSVKELEDQTLQQF